MRAVRVDKMTLAALEATLRLALGPGSRDPALVADGNACRSPAGARPSPGRGPAGRGLPGRRRADRGDARRRDDARADARVAGGPPRPALPRRVVRHGRIHIGPRAAGRRAGGRAQGPGRGGAPRPPRRVPRGGRRPAPRPPGRRPARSIEKRDRSRYRDSLPSSGTIVASNAHRADRVRPCASAASASTTRRSSASIATTTSSRSTRPSDAYCEAQGVELLLPSTEDLLDLLPPDGESHLAAQELAAWVDELDDDALAELAIPIDDVALLVPIPRPEQDPPARGQLRRARRRARRDGGRARRDVPVRLHEAADDDADATRRSDRHPDESRPTTSTGSASWAS